MLRFNIVKLLLHPKSILILNVLSMPKYCCAQILLLFGYLGTVKVMLPVTLISLAPLSILMQMELTDSSMKRVEVARTEIQKCDWVVIVPAAGCDFLGISCQQCGVCILYTKDYIGDTDSVLLQGQAHPLSCISIGNWRENKEDRCSQKRFLFLPGLGYFCILIFGYFKNSAVLFLAVKASETCCFQEDATLHIGSIS